jgi:hypothetical protein
LSISRNTVHLEKSDISLKIGSITWKSVHFLKLRASQVTAEPLKTQSISANCVRFWRLAELVKCVSIAKNSVQFFKLSGSMKTFWILENWMYCFKFCPFLTTGCIFQNFGNRFKMCASLKIFWPSENWMSLEIVHAFEKSGSRIIRVAEQCEPESVVPYTFKEMRILQSCDSFSLINIKQI